MFLEPPSWLASRRCPTSWYGLIQLLYLLPFLTPCRCLCVLLSLPQKPQVGFVGGTSSVAKTRANVAAGANSVEHVQVLLLRARICVTR